MTGIARGIITCLSIPAVLGWSAPDDAVAQASGDNCTFQASPDSFLAAQSRARKLVFTQTQKFSVERAQGQQPAAPVPHRNFIDDEIFNKLASMKVAAAQPDYRRRVLPADQPRSDRRASPPRPMSRAFLADTSSNKRDALIDKLLNSDAFNDKWTHVARRPAAEHAHPGDRRASQRQIARPQCFLRIHLLVRRRMEVAADIAYETVATEPATTMTMRRPARSTSSWAEASPAARRRTPMTACWCAALPRSSGMATTIA